MEKSIETVWKEGFLNANELVAPKLNNLYNHKSKHIIDKFKRMFKMNLLLITLGSFVILIASIVVELPYMGVPMFIIMNVLVIINKKLLNNLMLIDKGSNSYDYLIAFDNWIKYQVGINKLFARFLYPIVFLSLVVGFWMKKSGDLRVGEHAVNKLLESYPDLTLVFGVPLIGLVIVSVIVLFVVLVSGRVYEWDVNLVYGRVFNKLEEIISDIKELKGSL